MRMEHEEIWFCSGTHCVPRRAWLRGIHYTQILGRSQWQAVRRVDRAGPRYKVERPVRNPLEELWWKFRMRVA